MSGSAAEKGIHDKEKSKAAGKGGKDDGKRQYGGPVSLKVQQRHQLEVLMADPEKPVEIPEMQPDWKPPEPPEFKRFYMGSSAGAGSEVFHVYRHLRRYEMIRQEWIKETAEKEDKDAEFQMRLAEKRTTEEQKTAKKRAKRLRKKQSKEKKAAESKKTLATDSVSTQNEEGMHTRYEEESDNDDKDDDDAYENPFVIGGK